MINIFDYTSDISERRHDPKGYASYKRFKPWLRDEFCFKCIYCQSREQWYPNGSWNFGIDHIKAKSVHLSISSEYTNLVYSCNHCNALKGAKPLIDPVTDSLSQHIKYDKITGKIKHLTQEGQKIIKILCLNSDERIEYRRKLNMILDDLEKIDKADAESDLINWLGFPADLPDLAKLRPPLGNGKPKGINESWFVQRIEGRLPKTY